VATTSILCAAVEANLVVVARTVWLVAIDAHDTFRWSAGGTIGEVIAKAVPGQACSGLFALHTKGGTHSAVIVKRATSGEEVLGMLLGVCKEALPVTSATRLISIKPRCPACRGGWRQCGLTRGRFSSRARLRSRGIPLAVTTRGIALVLVLKARVGAVLVVGKD